MKVSVSLTHQQRPTLKVSMSFSSEHCVFGLTGKSGAGKSTLLRALCGLESHAQVSVDWGTNKTTKPRVGMVFQHPVLFPHLSVKESLELAAKYAEPSAPDIDMVCALCRCEHLLQARTLHLSGGEAQRVALACALLNAPDVLLIDEGLSAVDNASRTEILVAVLRYLNAQQCKTLLVSHDIDELLLFTQEVALMECGKVRYCGEPDKEQFLLSDICKGSIKSPMIIEHEQTSDSKYILGRYQGHKVYLGRPLKSPFSRVLLSAEGICLDAGESLSDSFLNALPCTVKTIEQFNEYQVVVGLRCEEKTLYALTDLLTAERLNLRPEKNITARFNAL